jgi:regulator of sirC expression with transglutaminase-like and TPR domain
LKRYGERTALEPAVQPRLDEKNVRVQRLINDAERARNEGRLLEAIGKLHDARALVPDRYDVLPRLGALYAQAGRRKDAVGVYQTYLKQRPKAKDAREIQGRVRALRVP